MTPVTDRKRRLALLKNRLNKQGLDALLVTDETNVSYLSGFPGHDSMLLVTPDKDHFITDSRYMEEAVNTLSGFEITLVERSTYDTLSEIIKKRRLKKVGFEAMDLSYGVATRLCRLIKGTKLTPSKDLVENIRSIKDAAEIAMIKDSVRLNAKVFDGITKQIRPGVSEKRLASMAETAFIAAGAKAAFDPIIASGENASKPHAIPMDISVKNNSFVMVDLGARLNGYCSDLTRMIVLGRVKEKFKKIHSVVRTAQDKAIATVRSGARIRDIDAAARGHIRDRGLGKYFSHSLGHGVGMSVHEKPTVSGSSEGLASAGMVFTIEPAIYIPKFGGVRIEDMVLVTDKGCEVLTR